MRGTRDDEVSDRAEEEETEDEGERDVVVVEVEEEEEEEEDVVSGVSEGALVS